MNCLKKKISTIYSVIKAVIVYLYILSVLLWLLIPSADLTPTSLVLRFGVTGSDLDPALAVSQSFKRESRRAASAARSASLAES